MKVFLGALAALVAANIVVFVLRYGWQDGGLAFGIAAAATLLVILVLEVATRRR